jgi:hypothetical protein
VKNHDFTPKNHIFSNFRGCAPPPPGSAPDIVCSQAVLPWCIELYFPDKGVINKKTIHGSVILQIHEPSSFCPTSHYGVTNRYKTRCVETTRMSPPWILRRLAKVSHFFNSLSNRLRITNEFQCWSVAYDYTLSYQKSSQYLKS